MDIVYVVGRGEWGCNELRYSLRSLVNLEHDRVFIVGNCPKWVDNIIHIPCINHHRKQLAIFTKIMAAVDDDRVSENFIYFADDYFLLQPAELKYYTNGPLENIINKYAGKYRAAMQNTLDLGAYWNFDIHTPVIYNKQKFKDRVASLDWSKEYIIKSAYFRETSIIPYKIEDAKSNGKDPEVFTRGKTFYSTGILHPEVKIFLKNRFQEKSIYEK